MEYNKRHSEELVRVSFVFALCTLCWTSLLFQRTKHKEQSTILVYTSRNSLRRLPKTYAKTRPVTRLFAITACFLSPISFRLWSVFDGSSLCLYCSPRLST